MGQVNDLEHRAKLLEQYLREDGETRSADTVKQLSIHAFHLRRTLAPDMESMLEYLEGRTRVLERRFNMLWSSGSNMLKTHGDLYFWNCDYCRQFRAAVLAIRDELAEERKDLPF